jgi:hypothetical protein
MAANLRLRVNHQCEDTTDPYKCDALLDRGRWVDSPDRDPGFPPFHNWQVPGCLLHEYTRIDIARCIENDLMVFIGDTGTRQVFRALIRKAEGEDGWDFPEEAGRNTHGDIDYERGIHG